MNVLIFSVGNVRCGLPLAEVREVMRPLAMERNQSLPACVLGTCMIRQRPTPVIDLSGLIGCSQGTPKRFITVAIGERQVALAVDAVLGTMRFDAVQFHEAAPLVCGDSDVVRALAVLDNKLVYVLNSARLLPNELSDVGSTSERAETNEMGAQQ